MRVLLALALVSCTSPAEPPRPPTWTHGPGCTLYWTNQLTDSIWEVVVEHVDRCPRVVMDSTRQ